VIGAGRIGAGYNWHDDAYTHAGAYQALRDRVELVGFIEPDNDRAMEAKAKWQVPVYEDVPTGLMALRPTIVSVCVQPEQQQHVFNQMFSGSGDGIEGVWCEKPFVARDSCDRGIYCLTMGTPIQVNYMRRGDPRHRTFAEGAHTLRRLVVYGKDGIHTRCHFEDLAKWWKVPLDYRVFNGPCAYILERKFGTETHFFDQGGVDGGFCFMEMLGNLLDHIDKGTELWSPA
jgi:hypothetical protein